MNSFFAGPVVPTLLKLAVLSLVAGLAFAILGVDPLNLWRDLGGTLQKIWEISGDFIQWGAKYAALGAVVVVPAWVAWRLLRLALGSKRAS